MDELLKRRRHGIAQHFTPYTPTQHVITLHPYNWIGTAYGRVLTFNVDYAYYGCGPAVYTEDSCAILDASKPYPDQTAQIFYYFKPQDIAAIPQNAVISSVVCDVMAERSSSKVYVYAALVRDYDATAVGRYRTFTSLSKQEVGTNGRWTRAQLDDCMLFLQAYNKDEYPEGEEGLCGKFYGADLKITCTY